MKERILLYCLLGMMIIILLKDGCRKPAEDRITVTTEHRVEHTTFIDTIPFYDTAKILVKIPIQEPMPEGENLVYTNPYTDSLLSGNITTVLRDGVMVDQSLHYTPKFPKYIIQKDTVKYFTTEKIFTEKNCEPKTQFFVGLSANGGRNNAGIGPAIGIVDKTGLNYSLSYDILNKNVNATFMLKLGRK